MVCASDGECPGEFRCVANMCVPKDWLIVMAKIAKPNGLRGLGLTALLLLTTCPSRGEQVDLADAALPPVVR